MRTKSTNSAIFPILFGFFVMGFVDVVGIATNYVKMDFGLSDTLANLLPMMVFLWFALFSVPTGIWMGRHGRRNTVVAALAITTLAMLIPLFFYDFACILFAFALLGIGNTILQVSLNPMVARVVNPDKVTSVLTLGQFIKAVSSFLGPIIAGVASSFWGDWKLIFIVYSVTTLLSIIWLIATIPGKEEGEEQEASFASTLALCKDARIRMLFLGILCIVGIDVGLNTTIPKLLMEKLSMPLQEAGLGSSLYFAARTGGSFLGAILLARISSRPFLRGSMLIAILAFIGLLISDSLWSMGVMIVLVGLACSNVFSILFSFALEHRPEQSNEVSALMIMGVSGGALITPCMGGLADRFGQVAGLMLLLICMLYIGLISIKHDKMKKRTYLSAGLALLIGTLSVHASPGLSDVKSRVLPAVYKSKNGLTQKVEISVKHEGEPSTVTIRLGEQSHKEKLVSGDNVFRIEIPEVSTTRQLPLTLTSGKEKEETTVTVKPVRHWQMNMVQHTHTDIGYTRSQMEILAEQLRYIDYALDYCDATDNYPDFAKFRWTCEIAWAVSEYLKCRPAEQIARLKQRVKEGRIELATMFLNFDELPDEQTLAASLYPIKQFRENGMRAEVAMQDDVNGIGWCFSEYFADSGVKYVNMGTHGHRALICFDKPTVFWWESPSGKKVLTYRAEHYHYGNFFGIHTDDFDQFEERVLTYLGEMEAKNYPYDILAVQHSGYLTDNAPPSTKSCEMLQKWNEKYEWPKLRTAVASEFFKTVESQYADRIETVRGAWPDWWTDGFASGAREAAISRVTHSDIIANQAGLSFAKMLGAQLPTDINDRIQDINKALLFYDEHTFGHSESVRNAYGLETWEQRSLKQSYAWEAYRHSGLLGEATMGILQSFVPKSDVPSIAVFNTLNWSYSGIAKAYVDHQILPKDKAFEIVDAAGNVIPAQAGESRSDGTYWNFYVKEVPALGYAQYYIKVKDAPRPEIQGTTELKETHVENPWYAIDFNTRKGTIRKLYDKDLNKQLVTPDAEWEMGEFIYEIIDSRHPMEQYRAPQFLRRRPEKMRFEKYEKGDVWDTYRFRGETVAGRESNNLMVEFRVFNVTKKIEVVYRLRKKAVTDPEAVYIAFPFEVEGGKIHLDVPGGSIEAGVDQIPGSSNDWYTVQNFATARNGESQVVMGSQEIPLMQFGAINTGRYKAGAVPQSTNMYSWPMNNYWVTNFNADQMGEMQWSYFINSSKDNSIEYATKFAWENRIPFLTRVLPAGDKKVEPLQSASIFKIVPENLLLVNMRPVEGENAVMLQLREIGGKPATFSVASDKINFVKTTVCDVVGDPVSGNPLSFAPWENKFIKLSW